MPVKAPLPTEPPFQIWKFNQTLRTMAWIARWPKEIPPGPEDLSGQFGGGRFEVRDAGAGRAKWTIANPSNFEADDGAPASSAYAAGASPPPWAGGAFPHPQGSGSDPYVHAMLARMEAVMSQIQTDMRRGSDEARSLRYEIEQLPERISARVGGVITSQADPMENMVRLWETTRLMSEGMPAAGDAGSPIEAAILGALSKFGGGAPPPQVVAPPQLAAVPQAPPPAAAPSPAPELSGLTPAIRAELMDHARAAGVSYDEAIGMARAKGWDAAQLLAFARDQSRAAAGA